MTTTIKISEETMLAHHKIQIAHTDLIPRLPQHWVLLESGESVSQGVYELRLELHIKSGVDFFRKLGRYTEYVK